MQRAHELASHDLGRHAKKHFHSDRIARTIMNFYQRGIHDAGLLSTIAANRERSITRRGEQLFQPVATKWTVSDLPIIPDNDEYANL